MSDAQNPVGASGNCLCGSVTINIKSMNQSVGTCHCDMCRKWSSGPFFAVDCGTDIDIEGKDNISIYDSSEWADRGFCAKCGSNLFYRLKKNQQYILSAGLFLSVKFNFDHQVFIDEKPEYYTFANKTKDMTGEQLFAEFSQES